MNKLIICTIATIALSIAPAQAGIMLFENDKAAWDAMVTTPVVTINWDDVLVTNYYTTISGNQYSGLPASPMLSIDAGSALYVVKPTSGSLCTDFFPVSGENVFCPNLSNPEGPQGLLTISFGAPVYALGVWFLDVEYDYAGTGIEIGGTLYNFSANQGDNSQSFLGIFSSNSFTIANIHMANGPENEGVGIDDVMYAVVPIPSAILLGSIGVGLFNWLHRRRTL